MLFPHSYVIKLLWTWLKIGKNNTAKPLQFFVFMSSVILVAVPFPCNFFYTVVTMSVIVGSYLFTQTKLTKLQCEVQWYLMSRACEVRVVLVSCRTCIGYLKSMCSLIFWGPLNWGLLGFIICYLIISAHGIMATTQELIDVLQGVSFKKETQAKSASSWWHSTTILVVLYLFCVNVWSRKFICGFLSATTVNQLQSSGEWSFSRTKLLSMPVYGVKSGWNYLYIWCLHRL